MITCPWCGTNYTGFQPNCKNCGGSLPLPAEEPRFSTEATPAAPLLRPSPAPRQLPANHIWRIVMADGVFIVGGILGLIGAIFSVVGCGLTVGIITAFVGPPFLLLGLGLLIAGVVLGGQAYRRAEITMSVLREGEAVIGQFTDVHQNYNVRVNGRHPWTLHYRFTVNGQTYQGKVSTLSRPDLSHAPGRPIYVLYTGSNPNQNTTYPFPYGYYET